MNPQEIIESIRKEKLSAGEVNLRTMAGAIDRLQKAFPRYGSFLMEFIQNADDAESTRIKIQLANRVITVSNNGKVFTEANVKSLCDIAGSTKSPEEYIGYLGVGFKSVFIVSDSPTIHSGDFRFGFNKQLFPNPRSFPWQIFPHWLDGEHSVEEGFTTTFAFEIKDNALVDKIREELLPESINERILLFLRHIKEIVIEDLDQNYDRVINKFDKSVQDDHRVIRIEQCIGQNNPTHSDWLIFRDSFDVPPEVSNDSISIDWERNSIRKREVVIAFRLSDTEQLVPEPKGTAHIGVFSFLPLKEIQSGLKFLIQADFLTAPGRGELARDCKWNEWLATCCFRTIAQKCIPSLMKNDKWMFNYSSILTSDGAGHALFKDFLSDPIESYLKQNLFLVSEGRESVSPNQAILIKSPIRSLFDAADLEKLYPDKKVIHNDCTFPSFTRVTTLEEDPKFFLQSEDSQELLQLKSQSKDVSFFIKLYNLIVSFYNYNYFTSRHARYNVEHDRFWDYFRDLSVPIILAEDFGLARIQDSFTNPKGLKVPSSLKSKPSIVHPEVAESNEFRSFVKALNEQRYYYSVPASKVLQPIGEADLRNRVLREELAELDETKWSQYTDSERIDRVKGLKQLFVRKLLKPDELIGKLTLLSKAGKWLQPSDLLFAAEYQPKHSLEIIIQKGLYDQSAEFVSAIYLDNQDVQHLKEWREFLSSLGVDKILSNEEDDLKPVVQRIAVLVTLAYERNNKRKSVERTESQKKEGWDVDSSNRKIEVKGTSRSSGYDLILTKNEQRALYKEVDYFIYIVTDVLSQPLLSVINGKLLLDSKDSEDVKLNFTYKAWHETSNAKVEEHQF